MGHRRIDSPLDELTPRERDVLALMAEGRSDGGVANELVVTVPTVERHGIGIFTELERISPTPTSTGACSPCSGTCSAEQALQVGPQEPVLNTNARVPHSESTRR